MESNIKYTKMLGRQVAGAARPLNGGAYHIIAGKSNQWRVVPEGAVRALRVFPTRKRAIGFAKTTASKKSANIVIHSTNGQVEDIIGIR